MPTEQGTLTDSLSQPLNHVMLLDACYCSCDSASLQQLSCLAELYNGALYLTETRLSGAALRNLPHIAVDCLGKAGASVFSL